MIQKVPATYCSILGSISLALLTITPLYAESLSVDTSDRQAVVDFYSNYYCTASSTDSEWSGDIAGGDAGSVSAAYTQVTLDRINYYRAMAGVPADITFREEWNGYSREAALMMSSNRQLDHYPTSDWTHYTENGALAARSSNLSLGTSGPDSVMSQLRDDGANNAAVGHRRWLLYPSATEMGFGTVDPPASSTYGSASAIWVLQENADTSEGRDQLVTWPPEGYVPHTQMFNRWSASYRGADFDNATVSVTKNGSPLTVSLEEVTVGYGDNTLVWTVSDDDIGESLDSDVTYSVTISNVEISGEIREFSYQVSQVSVEPALSDARLTLTGEKVERGIAQLTPSLASSTGCPYSGDVTIEFYYSKKKKGPYQKVFEMAYGLSVQLSTKGVYKVKIKGKQVTSKRVKIKKSGKVKHLKK